MRSKNRRDTQIFHHVPNIRGPQECETSCILIICLISRGQQLMKINIVSTGQVPKRSEQGNVKGVPESIDSQRNLPYISRDLVKQLAHVS